MHQSHLWREATVEVNGEITINIILEVPNQDRTQLWYRVPSQYSSFITPSCDPFVVGSILWLMKQATPLLVHGQVSPSLLRNLEEFQAAWSAWRPQQYYPIKITAEVEQELKKTASSDQAIVAFSGGVDSCFTTFRHRNNHCGRWQRNLQTGLKMVHSFDAPFKEHQNYDQAVEKCKAILISLGMDLIPVKTNFRQLPLQWEDAFGTGIASCLMLLEAGYETGLIASSFPYRALSFPYGSNPVSDPFLSSESFQIIHDGAAFSRIEKIREISDWSEALQNLIVCWKSSNKDRNCGQCEKCVRTILIFRILGLGLPKCFEQDVTDHQIENIKVTNGPLTEMERVLQAAKNANLSDSWVSSLEKCIKINQRSAKFRDYQDALKKRLPEALKRPVNRLRSLLLKD
jgi:hypothetical protein